MGSATTVRRSGHGWVIPRPDGAHNRCGGPAICGQCKAEAKDLAERGLEVVWAVRLAPGMRTDDDRVIEWVNGRQVGFTDGGVDEEVAWLPIRREPIGRACSGDPGDTALNQVRSAYALYLEHAEHAGEAWGATVGQIIAARDAGVSMARIGAEVGLTRERVRQIINEWAPGVHVNGG